MPDTDVKFFDGGMDYWDVLDRQVPQREANYNPLGGTGERACANCQWFIAPNSCVVIESFPEPIVPNGLSNEWRARVSQEAMMAPLPVFIVEQGESGLTAMKRERDGLDYPPEDFGIVQDIKAPSDWRLRLTRSPGTFDTKQIEDAIKSLSPTVFKGSDTERAQANGRILGAIRRLDVTNDVKDFLSGKLKASKPIQVVIHGTGNKPVSQQLFDAVKNVVSKVTGAELKPTLDFKAAAELGTSFKMIKDVNGDWRWIALVTNNFRDQDNPPEIFEDKAHKEFIDHLDGGGEFPELWLWHTPGTKFGQADWATYENGFVMMSGTVDGDKAAIAESLANQNDLGVSHGYSYLHSDKQNGIIGWYRTHEVTVLPHSAAANPWASIEFLSKELADMGTIQADKRSWLVDVVGEQAVGILETDSEGRAQVLKALGIESKAKDSDDQTDDGATVGDKDGKPGDAPALDAKAIVEAFAESKAFKDLTESLSGIETRLKAVEAQDDEKIASFFTAKSNAGLQGHVASQDANNVNQDRKDDGPSTEWFLDVVKDATEPAGIR